MTKLYHNKKLLILTCAILFMALQLSTVQQLHAASPYNLHLQGIINDTLSVHQDTATHKKKYFWRAAGETFGLNIALWAFDRYIQHGFYSYISCETIKNNFKEGFRWDNDFLSTNTFAHPYNGSLFFNAGRSNGYNFWQSELFAIAGSAMWELFMENQRPSTNDIIATPIGGAALGEVFYRTSDMILDDRSSGGKRFGRELAAFLISPMRGLNRIFTGQAWKKGTSSGRDFRKPPFHVELSLGSRTLFYHDDRNRTKTGASAFINLEYGDPFDNESKAPYKYFTCQTELNAMKTQPFLSRIEIIGSLFTKNVMEKEHSDLCIGVFQHFDFFDSDTISNYKPQALDPCVVPYKLATPASVGAGSIYRYQDQRTSLTAAVHLNGVLLGGILTDYYRYYHRNYNWAYGFSLKFGLNGSFLQNRLSFYLNNHFYNLYTKNTSSAHIIWNEVPQLEPVDFQGNESRGVFYHLEGQINFKLWNELFFTTRGELFHRTTHYRGGEKLGGFYINDWNIYNHQLSLQLMLTYKF